ncbi:phosphatidylglycerophosphatase A [Idiomarina tyrosinivorans]|uniref:Phosphatidylglycerophosphatase A n=1 Tax=Idiomarina tyrosinivorans TaxID=1445662 RepID=A0A432ZS82_9GAMM|nr:phosphatidylglycerophosphatase A [Idiomarina tyrosinivorans]RUO80770.1 phosphatidylglycerophosphatase A [Idiomarina tyrosinivorans]
MNLAYNLTWKNPLHWLAIGFGSGLLPKAPGTFGTVAAIPIVLLMHAYLSPTLYLLVLLLMTLAGVAICAMTAKHMGVHDHPAIVWDEIVGYAIAMFALPASWPWLLAAFVLFRFFDIRKPLLIGWCDRRLHGGWGIMMDDVVAGMVSAVILQVVAWQVGA